jgi:hypothetical protein
MAFNPFHSFRKHQKAIFAVLAIVCMLVFVLQFSAGADPFSRAMAWFGYRRAKGEVISQPNGEPFKLYDKKVHTGDLSALAAQRRLANDFISAVLPGQLDQRTFQIVGGWGEALQNLRTVFRVTENPLPDRESPLPPAFFASVHGQRVEPLVGPQVLRRYDWRQQRRGSVLPHERDRLYADILDDLRIVQRTAVEGPLTAGRLLSDDEVKALGQLALLLRFQAWSFDPQRTPKDLLFGGTDSTEDLLDFMVWRHQADRLGIVLVEDDVRKLINRDAVVDVLTKRFDQDERIKGFLNARKQRNRDLTVADLVTALTDEYRVVLAQVALLGQGPGVFAYGESPAEQQPWAPTPAEYLRYYREHRTRLDVTLLPVPAEKFLDKVQGSPTEEDLQRLFAKYKDKLPAPDSDTPGFTEPRRARVQYLSVTGDAPAGFAAFDPASWYYADQGRLMELAPFVQQWLGPWSALGAGGGPAAGAVLVGLPLTQDDLGPEASRRMARTAWKLDDFGLDALDTANVYRLGTLAFAVGMGHNGPFATLGNIFGDAAIYQTAGPVDQRLLYAALNVLAQSAMPNPTFGVVVPGAAEGYGLPLPPPRFVVEQVFKDRADRRAPQAMHDEISTFAGQLERLKGKPEEARAFVEKVQAGEPVTIELGREVSDKPEDKKTEVRRLYGLKGRIRSSADRLEDRYGLAKDEGLRPLREALERAGLGQPVKPDLADLVFAGNVGTYSPILWSDEVETSDLVKRDRRFTPLEWSRSREPFVVWRPEETRQREPKTLNEPKVRDEVVKAWRLLKARELARTEALALALRAAGDDADLNALRQKAKEMARGTGTAVAGKRTAGEAVAALQKAGKEGGLPDTLELLEVARLVRDRGPSVRASVTSYERYRVPPDKADAFPYPRANLVEQLQANLKKPGDVTVVADRPGRTQYVAVLTQKTAPRLDARGAQATVSPDQPAFLDLYRLAADGSDSLWEKNLVAEKRREFRQKFLEQLRAEASPQGVENGKFKLPDNIRVSASSAEGD